MVLTDSKKIASSIANILYIDMRKLDDVEKQKITVFVGSRAGTQQIQQENFPNLKFVQLLSAGYDGVDLSYFKKKGIAVANAANVYSVGMAEFVVYALLRSAKRYNKFICNTHIRFLRNYKYITELAGKKVTILGVGGIGGEIAKRLKAFDMYVCGFARHTKEKDCFDVVITTRDQLKVLLSQSDYVVSTLPHTQETENFFDTDLLSSLKIGTTLVNVGRRKVFNEHDLFAYLKKHKDVTAVLDIFERFPNPIANKFRFLRNVLILPGVTAISKEINMKLVRLVEDNLQRFFAGEKLLNQL